MNTLINSSATSRLQTEVEPHSIWRTALLFTLASALLLGLVYPLFLTALAHVFFPRQADGSLLLKDGHVIGSQLLAQSFTSNRYFHPRPSAAGAGYDAAASGGSNLAQSNQALVNRLQSSINALAKENPGAPVPIDLLTTSASGLDPDITPDSARFQIARVAQARGLSAENLQALVAAHTTSRQFGLLGEPRVNVLELNLALDQIHP